jgi:TetR/AcrR family transcriptional regulator, tetracycline repressor protein
MDAESTAAADRGRTPSPTILSRERLVQAALDLIQHDGLEALTMRALGDSLSVKAASLYWHVRSRAELLELVAAALLDEVGVSRTSQPSAWRADAMGVCTALERMTAVRRDAARVLLESPEAVARSRAHARLAGILREAGLAEAEAAQTAMLMLSAVLVNALRPSRHLPPPTGRVMELAIDSGSRGVSVRAGTALSGGAAAGADWTASPPAVVRGDRVIVRRLRGGRHGELELNPAHAWRFHVQAPTWNTLLDLSGLDLRGIHIDSGAARVECILPPPRGVVPIDVSSGVVGVRFRRPSGTAVVADVSAGNVQLRLDGSSIGATTADTRWQSGAGAAATDHYKLRINSGTVRVSLEEDASLAAQPVPAAAAPTHVGVSAALEVVLDGVAARSTR